VAPQHQYSVAIHRPELFSFSETIWFLDRGLDDCMHKINQQSVLRLFVQKGRPFLIRIFLKNGAIHYESLSGQINDHSQVADFINVWFDLDRDISPFYSLLSLIPEIAPLRNKYHGLRITGIPDLFEALCWCIIGQQINLSFAYRVKRRLVELYGEMLEYDREKYFAFPDPSVLAVLPVERYRSLQLTTRKAEYIKGLSEAFSSGAATREKLMALGDEEKMKEKLMEIRGIGEWTANYVVMKSLRGLNCLPYGDSGINNALNQFFGIPKKNNREQVNNVFNQFEGWKSYLVYYLWRSQREPGTIVTGT
jgi:DNA-3-methyladenine glycosylase II